MEFRIYAEDPAQGFLPSTGKIMRLREPKGPGIRLDSGIYEKYEVPVYYDPLLSKLIVYGETREDVIRRSRRALSEFVIAGVKTNLPFHRWLLQQEAFAAGDFDTHFIDQRFSPEQLPSPPELGFVALVAATLAYHQHGRRLNLVGSAEQARRPSRWRQAARREGVARRQPL